MGPHVCLALAQWQLCMQLHTHQRLHYCTSDQHSAHWQLCMNINGPAIFDTIQSQPIVAVQSLTKCILAKLVIAVEPLPFDFMQLDQLP